MFPIYPGFEDLPIRAEVHWYRKMRREQTRCVIARVAQWPTSKAEKAVLICSFEDDAELGEWIVTDKHDFYIVTSPQRWLSHPLTVSSQSPYLSRPKRLNSSNEKSISLLLKDIFSGDTNRHGLARIFYLPELPAKLNIIVQLPNEGSLYWCPSQNLGRAIPFTLAHRTTRLSPQNTEAYNQLRSAWQDTSSDARFAWEWSGLSKSEKILRLTGVPPASGERARVEKEMRRIMRLILINYEMWGPDEQWGLYFELGSRSHIWHEDGRLEKNDQHLHKWNRLLQRYLMPHLRYDWLEKHRCVEDQWPFQAHSAVVEIEHPPTAHEQLEAKLELRDWLRDKTTPDEAARLLAGLDD